MSSANSITTASTATIGNDAITTTSTITPRVIKSISSQFLLSLDHEKTCHRLDDKANRFVSSPDHSTNNSHQQISFKFLDNCILYSIQFSRVEFLRNGVPEVPQMFHISVLDADNSQQDKDVSQNQQTVQYSLESNENSFSLVLRDRKETSTIEAEFACVEGGKNAAAEDQQTSSNDHTPAWHLGLKISKNTVLKIQWHQEEEESNQNKGNPDTPLTVSNVPQVTLIGIDKGNRKFTSLKIREFLSQNVEGFYKERMISEEYAPLVHWLWRFDLVECLFLSLDSLDSVSMDTLPLSQFLDQVLDAEGSGVDSSLSVAQAYILQANRFNDTKSKTSTPASDLFGEFLSRILQKRQEALSAAQDDIVLHHAYNPLIESVLHFLYVHSDDLLNFQQVAKDALFLDTYASICIPQLLEADTGMQDPKLVAACLLSWPSFSKLSEATNEKCTSFIIDNYLNQLWKLNFFVHFDNADYFLSSNRDLLNSNLFLNVRDSDGRVPQPLKNLLVRYFDESASESVIVSLFSSDDDEENELENITLLLSQWGTVSEKERRAVVRPLYSFLFGSCIRESAQLLRELLVQWFAQQEFDEVLRELCIWHMDCFEDMMLQREELDNSLHQSVPSSPIHVWKESNFAKALPVVVSLLERHIKTFLPEKQANRSFSPTGSDPWSDFRRCLLFYKEKSMTHEVQSPFSPENRDIISNLLKQLIMAQPEEFIQSHVEMSLSHAVEIARLREDVDRLLSLTNLKQTIKKARKQKKNGYEVVWDPVKQRYVES